MNRRTCALVLPAGSVLLAGTAQAGLFKNDTYKVGALSFPMTLENATLKSVTSTMRVIYAKTYVPPDIIPIPQRIVTDVKRRELPTTVTVQGSSLVLSVEAGELPLDEANPDTERGGTLREVEYGVALTVEATDGTQRTFELRAAPKLSAAASRDWAHKKRLERGIREYLGGVLVDADRRVHYWNSGADNPVTGRAVTIAEIHEGSWGVFPPPPESIRRQATFNRLHDDER